MKSRATARAHEKLCSLGATGKRAGKLARSAARRTSIHAESVSVLLAVGRVESGRERRSSGLRMSGGSTPEPFWAVRRARLSRKRREAFRVGTMTASVERSSKPPLQSRVRKSTAAVSSGRSQGKKVREMFSAGESSNSL